MKRHYYKPAPNESTIKEATKVLIAYGHFRWSRADGFDLSKHDASRLAVWIDDAVKAGRLVRGRWRESSWIGYATLSRLVRAYLERALCYGTRNWDLIIAKCFSVVLVAALGARAGDVARSHGYTGQEYLQFRHIELTVEGDAPDLANLAATITLEFVKGSKDVRNDERRLHLRPLNDTRAFHVCPIALLLVHSLRHSLVDGSTLEEVLSRAFRRPDRRVVWLFPNRPVLTCFLRPTSRCDLDRPARADQINQTVQELGLVSGMLTRTSSHALRRGAARDIAFAPPDVIQPAALETARQALGHSMAARMSDVTERYVGDMRSDLYSARAASSTYHRADTKFASPDGASSLWDAAKLGVPEKEIQQAQEQAPGMSRPTAFRQIHNDRAQEARRTLDPEQRGRMLEMLQEPSPLPPTSTLLALAAATTTTTTRALMSDLATRPRVPLASLDPNAPPTAPSSAAPADPTQVIDPQLLTDEELATAVLPPDAVNELEAVIFATEPAPTTPADAVDPLPSSQLLDFSDGGATSLVPFDADLEEAASVLLDKDASPPTSSSKSAAAATWVTAYSRYNVVANDRFAKLWAKHCTPYCLQGSDFDDVFGGTCVQGGSRDPPQPLRFPCTKTPGCPFTSLFPGDVKTHERSCHALSVSTTLNDMQVLANEADLAKFRCPYAGCPYIPSPSARMSLKERLTRHISDKHDFQSRPCEYGCDPAKLYSNRKGYEWHISSTHRERFPARCTFPDCQHPTLFKAVSGLSRHLQVQHGLQPTEIATYVPARIARRVFCPQECPEDGCSAILKRRDSARKHLQQVHKKTFDEAEQWVNDCSELQAKESTAGSLKPQPLGGTAVVKRARDVALGPIATSVKSKRSRAGG